MVEIIIIIILCLITNIIKNLTSTNKIRTNIKPRGKRPSPPRPTYYKRS